MDTNTHTMLRNVTIWSLLVFLPILMITTHAQSIQNTQKTLALLKLSANGVSEDVVDKLSNELRIQLKTIGKYSLLDFSDIWKQLSDQVAENLLLCNQSTCAVQAGQLLDVDFVAIGGVGLIDGTYSMSIRVIEVNTGRVTIDVNEYYKRKNRSLEQELVPVVAAKVSGLEVPERPSKRGPLLKAIVIGSGVLIAAPIGYLIYKNATKTEEPVPTTEVKVQWN